ncbi:hypothetical protein D9613_008776 [Agrocybe pediades]|uniref:Uncharacterized protein n=1 Tax=Agrocybe pediades TaxID=84607 RepID=A0A8H4QUB0_9AGAR|nr:hypothetical protein D9613_008776 [Agrocybe pediades]
MQGESRITAGGSKKRERGDDDEEEELEVRRLIRADRSSFHSPYVVHRLQAQPAPVPYEIPSHDLYPQVHRPPAQSAADSYRNSSQSPYNAQARPPAQFAAAYGTSSPRRPEQHAHSSRTSSYDTYADSEPSPSAGYRALFAPWHDHPTYSMYSYDPKMYRKAQTPSTAPPVASSSAHVAPPQHQRHRSQSVIDVDMLPSQCTISARAPDLPVSNPGKGSLVPSESSRSSGNAVIDLTGSRHRQIAPRRDPQPAGDVGLADPFTCRICGKPITNITVNDVLIEDTLYEERADFPLDMFRADTARFGCCTCILDNMIRQRESRGSGVGNPGTSQSTAKQASNG